MITVPFAIDFTHDMLEPKEIPQRRLPRYGFHGHTERLNGRLAMVGFSIGVLTEALTGHSLISQVVFGVFGLSL